MVQKVRETFLKLFFRELMKCCWRYLEKKCAFSIDETALWKKSVSDISPCSWVTEPVHLSYEF